MTTEINVRRGDAPLIVSLPHTGTDIAPEIEARMASAWLARKDVDWWVDRLYGFAEELDATIVRTPVCRSVIDVNRDPSGLSLYPGQATTDLCPITSFDGEPLHRPGEAPDKAEVARRRIHYFDPFHAALKDEIDRLRLSHERVVLYDAHSIRSRVPRLFEGLLPHLNIGVNGGSSCAPELLRAVEDACDAHPTFSRVTDGRFRGGWITRSYGRPGERVHALQMELACRAYMDDPDSELNHDTWPPPYDARFAQPLRAALLDVLTACLAFTALPKDAQ